MFNSSQSAYVDLRNIVSERTRSLCVWTGSGLSLPAGLPSWKGLRDRLCEELDEKSRTLQDDEAVGMRTLCDKIRQEKNYWIAFGMLRSALGQTTYKSTIRKALTPADRADVPELYKQIWRLKPSGLLNLNIDRLASRAYGELSPGVLVHDFTGKEAGANAHVLGGPKPFIANLHGISQNFDTWVFTKNELKELLDNDAYKRFLSACLMTKVNLFVGLTVDDHAVGGHLAALSDFGISTDDHFWITDRNDLVTDKWAERLGIRVIRYQVSPSGEHAELNELFRDLLSYVSHDTLPDPVAPIRGASGLRPLPTQEEMKKLAPEEVRQMLNAHAASILKANNSDKYKRYEELVEKYDYSIYQSWYVVPNPPNNVLLGYKIVDEIAKGAFGKVYRAQSASGDLVAVKILREDVRRDPAMLQSFRRGVASMRILSERDVKGMIAYREAFEIPALVVMDLVEGPNLSQAVKAHQIDKWSLVLKIAADLTEIIREAHSLPERVLHRDIRPANVMLRGFFVNPDKWEVVVLDFDLSWHRESAERSIVSDTMTGYLAPEQVFPNHLHSTRNALVDSYGIGMTFYFLRAARDPQFNQQKHADWERTLHDDVSKFKCESWRSLPRRFARLILHATRDAQSDRWDMSQIHGELKRLRDAEAYPDRVRSAELLAEEVAFRSEISLSYAWDTDQLKAVAKLPSCEITVASLETAQTVQVTFSSPPGGRNVGRYVANAIEKMAATLKEGRWLIAEMDKSHDFKLVARISVRELALNLGTAVQAFDQAIACSNQG